MGNPHERFRSLHVAGTNGKGSVVATAAAVLRGDGQRVGTYTSPHLVDFRERIVVGGEMIPEEAVVEFTERWLPVCDDIGATFFEATTALAFDYFARAKVDVAVVETGLGGRLDSTNVLMPLATAVTTVSLDHTDLLGTTLTEIAAEKAGIFKERPAVIGERDPAVIELLRDHAVAAKAHRVVVVAEEWRMSGVQCDATGTSWHVEDGIWMGAMRTALIGEHQAYNTITALTLVDVAGGFWPRTIQPALDSVRLPGRFDVRLPFIFDVAHNPAAANALARTLRAVQPPRPVVALVAVLADKDWRGVLSELDGVVDRLVCTVAPGAPAERRWDPAAAAEHARAIGLDADSEPDFDAALSTATEGGGTTLVTGSFHTVGDAMFRLQVAPLAR